MFCTNCGRQLDETVKFCPYCGAKVDAAAEVMEQSVPQSTPEPVKEAEIQPEPEYVQEPQAAPEQIQPQIAAPVTKPEKKSKKGLIIGLIIGGVVLIGIIVAVLLILLPILNKQKKVTIDMMQYAYVEYSGLNSRGSAEAKYDYKRLIADYGEEIQYSREYKDHGEDPTEELEEFLLYYVDSYMDNLSNGDKVNYLLFVGGIEQLFNIDIEGYDEAEAEVAEDYMITKEFTVSGLDEIPVYDPFEGIEIEVTGRDHYGELFIDVNGCPEPVRNSEYSILADKTYDLANGDIITLTYEEFFDDDYLIDLYNMKPSRRTMEYTVEGLSIMLTSLDQIPADAKLDLEEACDDIFLEEFDSLNASNQYTDDYYIVGTVLKHPRDNTSSGDNYLYVIFRQDTSVVDESDGSSQPFTTYSVIRFDGVYINGDELEIDLEDYYALPHNFSFTRGVWTITGYYAYETLDEVRADIIDESDTDYEYDIDFSE